jgi:hypothetical protein
MPESGKAQKPSDSVLLTSLEPFRFSSSSSTLTLLTFLNSFYYVTWNYTLNRLLLNIVLFSLSISAHCSLFLFTSRFLASFALFSHAGGATVCYHPSLQGQRQTQLWLTSHSPSHTALLMLYHCPHTPPTDLT